jgi:peptidoglycan/LPS O-acetylase OafA/YrhL
MAVVDEQQVATQVAHVAPAHPSRHRGFAHQPALDGVRGLSIALVLLFHGGVSWMPGGYVGVSVFFTLSGFLITRLLLREHALTGRINVVRFWGKRIRRLAPASIVCLLAVAVAGSVGAFGDVPGLGRDLTGAVLQVANWFQITGDVSYSAQILEVRSPVAHYWSLAIEEQFYLVWPLVMVAVLRRRHHTRTIVALAAAAAAAAPVTAAIWGGDVAYWSTPARAGEILIGAALAAVLDRRRRRPSPWVALLALPALAVIGWAATQWESGSGPAYHGSLPVFALASAALILSLQVASPIRRAMTFRPLVALGVVSYGVYLYHWPVFLLLDGEIGGGRWVELGVEVAVTVALAAVSYRMLERPIRRGEMRRHQYVAPLAFGAAGVLVIAAIGTFGAPDRFAHPETAPNQLEPVASSLPPLVTDTSDPAPARVPRTTRASSVAPAVSTTPPTTQPAPGTDVAIAVTPSRPVRMLVVGDSTAWSLGDGLAAWAAEHPELASVALNVSPGCGFIQSGRVPSDDGSGYAEACGQLLSDTMMASLRQLQPDVVVLMAARTDVKDREWDAAEGTLSNADQRFAERQLTEYQAITDWVLGSGVSKVVWVKPLVVRADPAPDDETADPDRMGRLYDIIDQTVAAGDEGVGVVDLAGWYATSGIDDFHARIDGIHFEIPAATEIAQRFVGPTLVNLAVS